MKVKGILSLLVVAMAFLAIPATAQDRLGDLVAQGGYDWLIGRWVTTTEDGQESTYEQNWILDRHAIDVRFQMGDLEYKGMTAFIPYREEVIEVGADNQGGSWEGARATSMAAPSFEWSRRSRTAKGRRWRSSTPGVVTRR